MLNEFNTLLFQTQTFQDGLLEPQSFKQLKAEGKNNNKKKAGVDPQMNDANALLNSRVLRLHAQTKTHHRRGMHILSDQLKRHRAAQRRSKRKFRHWENKGLVLMDVSGQDER